MHQTGISSDAIENSALAALCPGGRCRALDLYPLRSPEEIDEGTLALYPQARI